MPFKLRSQSFNDVVANIPTIQESIPSGDIQEQHASSPASLALPGHTRSVVAVCPLPAGGIVTCDVSGTIIVWDTQRGTATARQQGSHSADSAVRRFVHPPALEQWDPTHSAGLQSSLLTEPSAAQKPLGSGIGRSRLSQSGANLNQPGSCVEATGPGKCTNTSAGNRRTSDRPLVSINHDPQTIAQGIGRGGRFIDIGIDASQLTHEGDPPQVTCAAPGS